MPDSGTEDEVGIDMKNREFRKATMIAARLRTDGGWTDATIRNISSHGAMLQLVGRAPCRGSYVELRRDTLVVVGRIMWSTANRCGINTRERIDVNSLHRTGQAPVAALPVERRRLARTATRSIHIKRHLEAAAIAIAILWSTATLGSLVFHTLSTPAQAAMIALSPHH